LIFAQELEKVQPSELPEKLFGRFSSNLRLTILPKSAKRPPLVLARNWTPNCKLMLIGVKWKLAFIHLKASGQQPAATSSAEDN